MQVDGNETARIVVLEGAVRSLLAASGGYRDTVCFGGPGMRQEHMGANLDVVRRHVQDVLWGDQPIEPLTVPYTDEWKLAGGGA